MSSSAFLKRLQEVTDGEVRIDTSEDDPLASKRPQVRLMDYKSFASNRISLVDDARVTNSTAFWPYFHSLCTSNATGEDTFGVDELCVDL